jgi:hypothetical protein
VAKGAAEATAADGAIAMAHKRNIAAAADTRAEGVVTPTAVVIAIHVRDISGLIGDRLLWQTAEAVVHNHTVFIDAAPHLFLFAGSEQSKRGSSEKWCSNVRGAFHGFG